MDIFSAFGSDTSKEVNGVEIEIAPDAFITVARSGNKKYGRILTKAFEANKYTIDRKDAAADAKAEQIVIDAMAQAILVGWRGNIQFKGEPLSYSVENAKKLLAVKDFRIMVSKHAEEFANFRAVVEDEDEKNSQPT